MTKRIIYLSVILLQTPLNGISYIVTRSQTNEPSRTLVGTLEIISELESHKNYGFMTITPEYQHSFRSDRIAQCLFGNNLLSFDNCPHIFISGSKVKNRGSSHWLADYFGLPPDFQSMVEINPSIQNSIIDVQFFYRWISTAFFVSIPFVYSKRSMNSHETTIAPGVLGYTAGYMSPEEVDRTNLCTNFASFMSGAQIPQLESTTFQPLRFGKISTQSTSKTHISDIQARLIKTLFVQDNLSILANMKIAIPTGTTPTSEFLFEPVIGNGNHWEIGAGISLGYKLWISECTQSGLDFFIDIQLAHLCSAKQCRSFDLCNGINSRYVLAHNMNTPIQGNLQGPTGETPEKQFKNQLTPIINLTTMPVHTKHMIQTEVTSLVRYKSEQWEYYIGYTLWALSCEKIASTSPCFNSAHSWALKGDSYLFGFDDQNNFEPVALSSTQHNATIHGGNNFPGSVPFVDIPEVDEVSFADQNNGVDNAQDALGSTTNDTPHQLTVTPLSIRSIKTSIQPVLLSDNMIDICSTQSRSISHSVFMHINYLWNDTNNQYCFFLGGGGEIEFVPRSNNSECYSCPNCALTQAALWLKGGINFN